MDGRKHVVNITSLQRNSHHPKMMISGRVSAKNDSEQEGRFFRALPVIFLIFYKEIICERHVFCLSGLGLIARLRCVGYCSIDFDTWQKYYCK
jgi:hypothetical protein